jgi:(p)ppGpp synthase/HD superfamily hydrolase
MKGIEETIELARELHSGQVDKGGRPYVEHVIRVWMRLVARWPSISMDAQHAALLHDSMEDCGVTADRLRALGYSERTIRIVELLSSNQPMYAGMTYQQKIEAIAGSGDYDAIKVKLADNSDNSDPSRPLPPDMQGIGKRYARARETLERGLAA